MQHFFVIILSLLFCFSCIRILQYKSQRYDEETNLQKLKFSSEKYGFGEQKERQPNFKQLYEKNSDFAGWIQIEGTNIDYPVMYSPDDVEFYLHHDFEKMPSQSGIPFLGKGCTLQPLSKNVILYGHHMKDGTMFADLLRFREEDYRNKHPNIQFDTLFTKGVYEVIWAFDMDISYPQEFNFYEVQDLNDPEIRSSFVSACQKRSLYTAKPKLQGDDEFLTLITCGSHDKNSRFLVVAKRIS